MWASPGPVGMSPLLGQLRGGGPIPPQSREGECHHGVCAQQGLLQLGDDHTLQTGPHCCSPAPAGDTFIITVATGWGGGEERVPNSEKGMLPKVQKCIPRRRAPEKGTVVGSGNLGWFEMS